MADHTEVARNRATSAGRLGSVARDGLALRVKEIFPDLEDDFLPFYRAVAEFTMTSVERIYALYKAVPYVHARGIPGDIVECGVWRGGSTMLVALLLIELQDHERLLYLYDTYSGMSDPGSQDVDIHGNAVIDNWRAIQNDRDSPLLCFSTLAEVQENMATTGFPASRVVYVEGKVEETLPRAAPGSIAILRLDTDWYSSTARELQSLYPRVSPGGVVIIDDYGHWRGARAAVDEYFSADAAAPLLHRIDYTGRIAVKPG